MSLPCTTCKRVLPESRFSLSRKMKRGFQSSCKECTSEYNKIHYQENKTRLDAKAWNYRLQRLFGITVEDARRILADQDHQCHICGAMWEESSREFHVDHNHATGEVRGILCGPCNNGLGFFRDNPEFLAKAIIYLKGEIL